MGLRANHHIQAAAIAENFENMSSGSICTGWVKFPKSGLSGNVGVVRLRLG
jgi:hypothetical protein